MDGMTVLISINAAALVAVGVTIWRSGSEWGSTKEELKGIRETDLVYIRNQLDKTNGTVRNHETRISRIEGQHKAEAQA